MDGVVPGTKKKKSVSYSKWGYIFIAPFFIVYGIFYLYPLFSTFYNSFFENYRIGLLQVGPNFVGWDNYRNLFSSNELLLAAKNTAIIWIMGFIPQIVFSLLLAVWFTDLRLRLRGTSVFRAIIYLPNLIMAAAFSMLFWTIFSDNGPVNQLIMQSGGEQVRFLSSIWGTRGLIALMAFLMWFGNTTIMVMAGILGIDSSIFETAEMDGASSTQIFWKVTLPVLKPILVYVMLTSMIGGIQMFDLPQVFTDGTGNPARTSLTLVMYLNRQLYSRNFGVAGAISGVMFIGTAIISIIVYRSLTAESRALKKIGKRG